MDKELKENIGELDQLLGKYLNLSLQNENSKYCIKAYLKWYNQSMVIFKRFLSAEDEDLIRFRNVNNSGNGFVLNDNYQMISSSYEILKDKLLRKSNMNDNKFKGKPFKIFISHSSNDRPFCEALVKLLEFLGLGPENVFCSSVEGYGIELGNDIFETLKSIFEENQIIVFFILSRNYYQSPYSLNEMGAAWILKTEFISFLTKGFGFKDALGIVKPSNKSKPSVNPVL